MSNFLKNWATSDDFRDMIILIHAFFALIITLLVSDFPNHIINPNYKIATVISVLFFIFIIGFILLELMDKSDSIEDFVIVISTCILIMSILSAFLIRDSNIIVGGATLILVVITVYNINKSNEIAKIQIKNQNEPFVVVSVKENDIKVNFIDLIIENVGSGIAKNVHFEITPPGFTTLSGDPLEKLFFFQNGIQTLASKQKYVIHLTELPSKIQILKRTHNIKNDLEGRQKLKEKLTLNFTLTYYDIFNNKKIDNFEINLCIFWGLRYPEITFRSV